MTFASLMRFIIEQRNSNGPKSHKQQNGSNLFRLLTCCGVAGWSARCRTMTLFWWARLVWRRRIARTSHRCVERYSRRTDPASTSLSSSSSALSPSSSWSASSWYSFSSAASGGKDSTRIDTEINIFCDAYVGYGDVSLDFVVQDVPAEGEGAVRSAQCGQCRGLPGGQAGPVCSSAVAPTHFLFHFCRSPLYDELSIPFIDASLPPTPRTARTGAGLELLLGRSQASLAGGLEK